MPYSPVQINNPGIAPGINQLSGVLQSRGGIWGMVEDWQKKRDQQSKEEEYNNAIVFHAKENGQVSEEELNKYRAMSHTAKVGFAAGLAANLASDLKRQSIESEIAARNAASADANWLPTEEDRARAQAMGGDIFQTGKGRAQFVAGPEYKPYTWEDLNKEVRAATGADLGDWQNAKNKRDEGGNVVADITKSNVFGDQVQSTIRVPKNTYNQFLSRFNQLQGGQPASDLGISREEQANQIGQEYRAEVANTKDPKVISSARAEAKRKLQALGFE